MVEEQNADFKRLIIRDLIKLSIIVGGAGYYLYSTYEPAVQSEPQTILHASEATLQNLKQKCDGKSYTIVIEDHPGRAEFRYNAEQNTYAVSLGLSAAGVNECEKYERPTCVAYKSDFAPSKWIYQDNNADGLVDLVLSYKQNRDGTEVLMATQKPTVEQAMYVRQLQYFEEIQAATISPLVKVAPCSQ